ncbi:MAG TPA: hypothetical protein VJT82_11735 [Pyrinomonadaceae bacterium]|nr:hypothetical protein [Pyrinomonadaceae bacterium]
MKRRRKDRERFYRKKGDTARLAAHLAPLEEREPHAAQVEGSNGRGAKTETPPQNNGAIIVDANNVNVPKGMVEGGDDGSILGIEPVVLVILVAMLAFTAFIAWQISQMPTD